MKKPEKSLERRRATLKRGAKRNERMRKTQANKWLRNKEGKNKILSRNRKFQSYLQSLMGNK